MVYVTGTTWSPDFPLVHPFQSSCYRCGLMVDATFHSFVAKLDPRKHRIVYSTYLGGEAEDTANAIGVDAAGQAIVVGWTDSAAFPIASAFQPSLGHASGNGFVTKLNAQGTELVYSTFLGGTRGKWTASSGGGGDDLAMDVAVDKVGNAVVVGGSMSSDFPLLHPIYASHQGLEAYFAAGFSPSDSLRYSTFLAPQYSKVVNTFAAIDTRDRADVLEPNVEVSVLTMDGQRAAPSIGVPETLGADGIAAGPHGQVWLCGNLHIPEHHTGKYDLPETQAAVVRLVPTMP
jgi:hypothetical protein